MSTRPAHRPKGSKAYRNGGRFKKCACGRRHWARCSHPTWGKFTFRGNDIRVNLALQFQKDSVSWSEAEALLDLMRSQIRTGTFVKYGKVPTAAATPAPATDLTLREIADKYHEDVSLDPKRRAHRLPVLRQALNVILRTVVDGAPFGDKSVEALRTLDLEKFRTARRALFRAEEARLAERRKKIAANEPDAAALPVPSEIPHGQQGEVGIARTLQLLRRLLNWSIERDYRTSESPFRKHGQAVFKIRKGERRKRRLQPGEEERLLAAAPSHLRACIEVALATAMRREEILSLTWADIECDAKGRPCFIRLRAENTKTDKARSIPVSSALRALLEMRRNGPDDEPLPLTAFVLGDETGTERQDSIKSAWRSTCVKAGVEDLHFHDLRRTAASRWLQSGRVGLLEVRDLLGHSDVSQTSSYLDAGEGDTARAMEAFDRHQRQLAAQAARAKASKARRKRPSQGVSVH
ncbi:MAG: site-specific integrase [Vicinamibacterales bacterium]